MPPRPDGKPVQHLHLLPQEARLALDRKWQLPWYLHAAQWVQGKSVLDVGAGTGYGLLVLRDHGAASVQGLDPLPCGNGVVPLRIEEMPDGYVDIVTAMDVIEHVEPPPSETVLGLAFLRQLVRVARELVFFSTPNFNRFGCTNPAHVFELTPAELTALTANVVAGDVEIWLADDQWRIEPCPVLTVGEGRANFGVLLRLGG